MVPVFDTAPTERFAEVTLTNVTASLGLTLDPGNTDEPDREALLRLSTSDGANPDTARR